jgi:hypothetical protein
VIYIQQSFLRSAFCGRKIDDGSLMLPSSVLHFAQIRIEYMLRCTKRARWCICLLGYFIVRGVRQAMSRSIRSKMLRSDVYNLILPGRRCRDELAWRYERGILA